MYIKGIPQFHDLSEVVSNSVRICRSTHADRRCVTSAVMVSVIIALLLQVRKILILLNWSFTVVPLFLRPPSVFTSVVTKLQNSIHHLTDFS